MSNWPQAVLDHTNAVLKLARTGIPPETGKHDTGAFDAYNKAVDAAGQTYQHLAGVVCPDIKNCGAPGSFDLGDSLKAWAYRGTELIGRSAAPAFHAWAAEGRAMHAETQRVANYQPAGPTTKSSAGGKRAGAGRKPDLTDEEVLQIATDWETSRASGTLKKDYAADQAMTPKELDNKVLKRAKRLRT